jgi:hypothetical protein
VRRALARDPERRYQTAAAIVDDLDALAKAKRWTLSCTAVGELVRSMRGAV